MRLNQMIWVVRTLLYAHHKTVALLHSIHDSRYELGKPSLKDSPTTLDRRYLFTVSNSSLLLFLVAENGLHTLTFTLHWKGHFPRNLELWATTFTYKLRVKMNHCTRSLRQTSLQLKLSAKQRQMQRQTNSRPTSLRDHKAVGN